MKFFQHFHYRRLAYLIRRDMVVQSRTYLIALGALFSALVLANLASIVSAETWNFHSVFYPLTLLLGGFVFTSLSFYELGESRSRAFYLSLPASHFEKLFSKWFITGPGYACVSLALYFIFSLTVYGLSNLLFGAGHRLFDPLDHSVGTHIRFYLGAHAVFFLGAVSFHKNAFLKTILTLFGFLFAYAASVALVIYCFLFATSLSGQPYISFEVFDLNVYPGMPVAEALREVGAVLALSDHLLRYLLVPFLWLVAYYRLKEAEA